jgi:hypothetical protein
MFGLVRTFGGFGVDRELSLFSAYLSMAAL